MLRMKAVHKTFHQFNLLMLSGHGHSLDVLQLGGHGFFYQTMLARGNGLHGPMRMLFIGHRAINRFHLGVIN